MINRIKGALFGLSVGDALGVPVEFKSREFLKTFPVKDMTGYGSWNQPPGTWSDDSSLAFCLAESLSIKYDLNDIANRFKMWYETGYWGAHYKVFDVGGATRFAIQRLQKGESPLQSGGIFEEDNGNGSLMRIIPLLFYIKDLPVEERYMKVKEVSSITHAHFRSVLSCFVYLETALLILKGKSALDAYMEMCETVIKFSAKNHFSKDELKLFDRVFQGSIDKLKETDVHSGGYVLQTLEASLWCLLTANNYADAVLKAVNLGADTDTTGCVTGGLAGLYYGYEAIPEVWLNELARRNDIDELSEKLFKATAQ